MSVLTHRCHSAVHAARSLYSYFDNSFDHLPLAAANSKRGSAVSEDSVHAFTRTNSSGLEPVDERADPAYMLVGDDDELQNIVNPLYREVLLRPLFALVHSPSHITFITLCIGACSRCFQHISGMHWNPLPRPTLSWMSFSNQTRCGNTCRNKNSGRTRCHTPDSSLDVLRILL